MTNTLQPAGTPHAETELKYRTLFEQSPDGILILDPEGHILDFNTSAHRQLGYTREEFARLSIADLDPVETPSEIQEKIRAIMKFEKAEHEVKHKTKQGEIRDVHVIVQKLVLSGKLVLYAIWRDITERKRAEAERQQYLNLFYNSSDLMVIADPNGAFLKVNPACTRTLGYSEEELVSKPFVDFIHPEDKQPTIDEMARQLQRGFSLNFENRYVCRDGSIRWLSWRATYHSAEGITYATARDITDLKKAEEEREQFYKFFVYSNDLMCIAGTDGYFKILNPAWSSTLGYTTEELLQKPFVEFIHPEDAGSTMEELKRLIAGHGTVNFTNRYLCKDGSYKWMEWEATPPRNEVIFAIARDVTDRKQAEEKIRKSEQFIRNILDTVDEGFIVINRVYQIMVANKAYCGQADLPFDQVIGKHCYQVSHRSERPCFEAGEECAVRQVFATGEPHTALHKHVDRDGHVLYVETKGFPIKDAAGNVTSVIETVNNITEKHLLEEERLKTQKLESVGMLAGGIAHDFNNLLQGIFGYISMAKRNFDQREKSLAMLEQAEYALQQSVNLTTQLLTFSKGGKPIKKLIDLRPLIENSTRFALSGSRSDFRMDIAADLWQAEADEGQVGQVVQNIVLNAYQSMPLGGSIFVTARNVSEGEPSLPSGLAPGNYVKISIRDTGVGIPEKFLGKIFDPYFTTKEKGSGLGLATSYSIVRNHGGVIIAASKAGDGSTFTIYLPALAGVRKTTAAEPTKPVPMRTARVLVMDDEEILRNLSKEIIGALGHEVEVAKNGQEAVDKYRQALQGKPFDLVILDLTIRGGLGGLETIQKLREIDTDVKAIVSSGYSDDATTANHLAHGFKAFLKKPYDIDALREVLTSVMR